MKINRRQLRRLIIAEAAKADKADKKEHVINAIKVGALARTSPILATPYGLFTLLVLGKQLDKASQAVYKSLDPRIKSALDGLVSAVKSVPGDIKESLIITAVEYIDSIANSIDFSPYKDIKVTVKGGEDAGGIEFMNAKD